MEFQITAERETFPIDGVFTIARGSRTEAQVIHCTISADGHRGHSECVPYARYGETVESVIRQIDDAAGLFGPEPDHETLLEAMPAGAARNAIDCALWDLEAKRSGVRAHNRICRLPPRPVTTAYTISLGDPADMAANARAHSGRPLLKIKVGGENDIARIEAVASVAPNSRIILDANEGWTPDNIRDNLRAAATHHIALVEQPLPPEHEEMLRAIPHPVPICADESVHTTADLARIAGLYDLVNIKLDKTGGLTEALRLRDAAREMGFGIMVGCMVGTSLAMAPAVLLAQDADYVDLDGPLLLARDRHPALTYTDSLVSPSSAGLWG